MPWKRETPMDQKMMLIGDWLGGDFSKSELARYYGVSRPTVHKWISRYEQEGNKGLEERSRAPLSCPHQTGDQIVRRLIKAKQQHMDWGPKKLVRYLRNKSPQVVWPASSTAGEILHKAGLVSRRQRIHKTPLYEQPLSHCQKPNQVWSVDYKGQFRTGDGHWCYPLTLTDNDSRYLLACQGLHHPRLEETRPWLEWAFREYGLPNAIRSDNGAPFASTGLSGLSALSVWWLKLGITPERIKPGRPDQNGRHERMHRSLKAATLNPPAQNLRRQQAVFNAFVEEFNSQRPHEALGMETPSSRYYPSERAYPMKIADVEYGDEFEVRRVRSNGEIKWRGQLLYTSGALIGELVGLKVDDHDQLVLFFSTCHIGTMDPIRQRFVNP